MAHAAIARHVSLLALATAVAGGCTSDDGAAASTEACAEGEKICDGACVRTDDPGYGCRPTSCEPCPAGVPVRCEAGACVIEDCPVARGDCDGDPANGCEVDLRGAQEHCGTCGRVCSELEECASGTCATLDVARWLSQQKGGWCHDLFNEVMNLCGDVAFCFDPDLMRAYPDGLEVHVGFHWDGASTGLVFDAGGDCEGKRMSCTLDPGGVLYCNGPLTAAALTTTLGSAGPHLVSYRVSRQGASLFVDGEEVGTMAGSTAEPELLGECGPGLVLGQRISYWWEQQAPGRSLRFAPFLFHLKARPSALPWTLTEALVADASSVVLFDAAGVDGMEWTDSVAGKVGVRCGGRTSEEASGYDVPCAGPGWVADVARTCL